jgi:hypothetical protein
LGKEAENIELIVRYKKLDKLEGIVDAFRCFSLCLLEFHLLIDLGLIQESESRPLRVMATFSLAPRHDQLTDNSDREIAHRFQKVKSMDNLDSELEASNTPLIKSLHGRCVFSPLYSSFSEIEFR